jgi:ribonucleoside-triphosphate reductase
MVPYVRKSFYKHFKRGLKYCESNSFNSLTEIEKNNFLNKINENLSIDNEIYKMPFSKAYSYALD